MPLVVISSPKGGVGKTTLVANLGVALARRGRRILLVDFDVQNALRLHFDLPIGDTGGYVARAVECTDWQARAVAAAPGLDLLRYGVADPAQRQRFEQALAADGANFLASRLRSCLDDPDRLVIADTPPGPSPGLDALCDLANLRIAALLSDAASLALVPQALGEGRFFRRSRSGARPLLLLNQVDARRRLNRDVTALARQMAQDDLLGTVRQDEALAEAVAQQCSVFDHAPHSAAAQDLAGIARRLDEMLMDRVPDAPAAARSGG